MSQQSIMQSIEEPITHTGGSSRHATLLLRPATAADLVFQRELYRERRAAELAAVPWHESDKQAFCDMQFLLQRADWAQRFPDARYWMLCSEDNGRAVDAVGLLIWMRHADGLHLIDLALLPDWRGAGWGTRILRALQQEADPLPLRLNVERNSAALRLYQRLGFVIESEADALRLSMVWRPTSEPEPVSKPFRSECHESLCR